jgi:DNA-directed RNA polymerase subunit M/transcription elongation factor TFIIS
MKEEMILSGGSPMKPSGPKFNPLKYENIKCDKCGNETFESAFIIKNIPGLVLGQGNEDIQYPMDVVVCKKCGAIMKDYRKEYKLEEFAEKKEENKGGLIL